MIGSMTDWGLLRKQMEEGFEKNVPCMAWFNLSTTMYKRYMGEREFLTDVCNATRAFFLLLVMESEGKA